MFHREFCAYINRLTVSSGSASWLHVFEFDLDSFAWRTRKGDQTQSADLISRQRSIPRALVVLLALALRGLAEQLADDVEIDSGSQEPIRECVTQ